MPTASLSHWGPTTVLPTVTGQLVGFTRDPSEFKINEWVQYVKTDNPQFLWYELERDQSVRVIDDALFAWEDGTPRPTGNHNLTRFLMQEGRCFRRAYPWRLGEQAIDVNAQHGAIDPQTVEAKSCASQAMVNRTNRIVNMLQTDANWNGNSEDANVLNAGAGRWDRASDDESSPFYLAIYKSLMGAMEKITLLTNGKVRAKDMVLVISPRTAIKIGQTAEVHNYVKYNASAGVKVVEKTLSDASTMWGCPAELYGFKVVVEDCVRVSSNPVAAGTQATIASGNRAFVKSNDTAFLVSRAGGLDAPYKSKSFSTVQCYFYKYEMAAESRYDSWDKLYEGSTVEQFKEIFAAPVAGYHITDILS